jgi:hypothetical protein
METEAHETDWKPESEPDDPSCGFSVAHYRVPAGVAQRRGDKTTNDRHAQI